MLIDGRPSTHALNDEDVAIAHTPSEIAKSISPYRTIRRTIRITNPLGHPLSYGSLSSSDCKASRVFRFRLETCAFLNSLVGLICPIVIGDPQAQSVVAIHSWAIRSDAQFIRGSTEHVTGQLSRCEYVYD